MTTTRLKVAIHTLGCKLNQAESETLARRLIACGYALAEANVADVCVINTCTVTQAADSKAIRMVRSLINKNPTSKIVATGCYTRRAAGDFQRLGVAVASSTDDVLDLLSRITPEKPDESPAQRQITGRTRTTLKIQDGCSGNCSYCIVPYVRGAEQSVPLREIIDEVKTRIAEGYLEVVLTGTRVGAYMSQESRLVNLLEQVLSQTNVRRLRLSSLQPREISTELLGLWTDSRLCQHFHLSLQSGSEEVLKRMQRHYSLREYREAVAIIRDRLPNVAITTDVIAGFPGETEEEFEESYAVCRDLEFARIHVFPYSPRPGTTASLLPGQIPGQIKTERSRKLQLLSEESAANFGGHFIGQTLEVLWENARPAGRGRYSGLTGNYLRVTTESRMELLNTITPVLISGPGTQGMCGQVMTVS